MFAQADAPSVYIITVDDISTEFFNYCGEGPPEFQPETSSIDEIAAMGMQFTNFWSMPLCTPTRACVATGRWSSRMNVWDDVGDGVDYQLPLSAVTFPEVAPGVFFAHLGKWHLGTKWQGYDPVLQGFDLHVGTQSVVSDYFTWTRKISWNGYLNSSTQSQYVTQQNTDNFIAVQSMLSNTHPTCIWFNYHSAHKPLHDPPGRSSDGTKYGKYKAMIEYLDDEIARVLMHYDPMVDYLILFSDNGSTNDLGTYPTGKGDVREPGINVPLVIAGPGIAAGSISDSLCSVVDLHRTILELVGVNPALSPAEDSRSLVPILADPTVEVRPWNYAERFLPDMDGDGFWELDLRAARDPKYKLIWEDYGNMLCFTDIGNAVPGEEGDLLDLGNLTPEQQASFDLLFSVVTARGQTQ